MTRRPWSTLLDSYPVAADTTRARFSAWVIEHKKPRCHTAYFSVLDEIQHATGPYSRELFEALEAVDGMVATVERAARTADPRSIVCVVSDHGFAKYDRTIAINVALREAGLIDVIADAAVRDWKAMTWANAVMLKDSADEPTRATVASLLARLAADPATGVFKVMTRDEVVREGGFPGAAFVVGVRPGFAISGRVEGPLVKANDPAGTHGLLRERPEMDSAFLIAGEGIPRGRVFDRVDMRDIAPTLARLAGVALPDAEGRVLFHD